MDRPIPPGLRVAAAVAATELRRTLRDPHVVAYLLAPIALYPMLVWGGVQLGLYEEGRKEREPIRVEVRGSDEVAEALGDDPFTRASGGPDALASGELDVLVEVDVDGQAWTATLHHASTRARSRRGLDEVRDALGELRERRVSGLAEGAGVEPSALRPVELVERPMNGVEAFVGAVVAVLLGYIGAFAMLLATIYPAIDVIVAEREKGTLETLLLAPGPRWALLLGKTLGCAVLVLLASLANMASLALTLAHLRTLVPDLGIEITLGQDPLALFLALPVLATTALLIASVSVLVVLPARTFKEGEMIATTVVMTGIVPIVVSLVAVIAGDSGWLVAVPIANLLLALQRGLTGDLSFALAAGATFENLALSGAALAGAAALAGREDFLVGGRLPRWLSWLHRSEAA